MANKFLGIVDPNAILRGEFAATPGDTLVAESVDKGRCAACVYDPGCRESVGGWGDFRLLHVGLRTTCMEVAETYHAKQSGIHGPGDTMTRKSHGPRI